MKALSVIGAGGHGKVVAEIAIANGWDTILFYDRAYPKKQICGAWKVIGTTPETRPNFCAVGKNVTRQKIFEEYDMSDSPVLCHPASIVSGSAFVGAGSVLMAGAILNAGAHLGRGVIINTCASVDHDCHLADFVHVSPGARLAGDVNVGPRSWIGLNAAICEGVEIGQDAVIGAGAVVIKDVPDGARVVGNPASEK